MRETIEYLLKIEKTAGDIYTEAAVFFRKDKEFARFLSLLAEDEADHFDAVTDVKEQLEHLAGNADKAPAFITLDAVTKRDIERPFIEAREKLLAGDLTKDAMMSLIVAVEFSEWNHIFLYFLNTMRGGSLEFQRLAAMIEQHKKRIETFLESLPEGHKYLEMVRGLPSVWRPRILIVEDDVQIAQLLSAVLARQGEIETVESGERALQKTSVRYFDVIISDVHMPVMNGIEFYSQAAKADANVRERFLFLTAFPTDENIAFFTKNQLKYMEKPIPLDKVRRAVQDIVQRASEHP